MEAKGQLAKAIIKVMQEIKGIEKNAKIGTGSYAYNGVSDQEVKQIVGEAMAKAGLCIVPIGVEPKTQIARWTEAGKEKQAVFTEVTTKYLLMHEGGESVELAGYGQGADSQDKSAGKATTYALKYVLLYTFLIPTGKIDDTDATHSNDLATPKVDNRPWLTENMKAFTKAKELIGTGEKTLDDVKHTYQMTEEIEQKLLGNKK